MFIEVFSQEGRHSDSKWHGPLAEYMGAKLGPALPSSSNWGPYIIKPQSEHTYPVL